jgi:hypothetical protein
MIEFRLGDGVTPNFHLVAILAEQPGFQVLTPADLNGPFNAEAWPHVLSPDIKYWQAANLGEAHFNYWD